MPVGAVPRSIRAGTGLARHCGMASDIRNWRRAFWTCAATAVVIVAGCGRLAAQDLVAATTAIDDPLENTAGLLPAPASAAASPAGQAVIIPSSSQRVAPALTPLARWVDVQTGTMATRFRFTETSAGVVTQDQLQHSEQIKARVKVDRVGRICGRLRAWHRRYVRARLEQHDTRQAAGTPNEYSSNIFVKQLFASATPAEGVEIQAGGLGIVKGENTEVTSYDNDGYMSVNA